VKIAWEVAYLYSFDDHLLADIGLNRSDIEVHVRNRVGQKAGRIEPGLQTTSYGQHVSCLHSPVVQVGLGSVANVALLALFAYYPARWLGLW